MIGKQLRAIREEVRLTPRDVEERGARLAQRYKNPYLAISAKHLDDLETDEVIAGMHSLLSLGMIYRRDIRKMLLWFGVDTRGMVSDRE
jgi:hypothetical protein